MSYNFIPLPFVELIPTCGWLVSGAGELSSSLNKPVQLVDINEALADITDKLVN